MAENKLADLSTEFAIKILKLTDSMKGHYSLTNQLERSGTSVGANIRESVVCFLYRSIIFVIQQKASLA